MKQGLIQFKTRKVTATPPTDLGRTAQSRAVSTPPRKPERRWGRDKGR